MTTYSKETALYNTGAIGADIQEAGTKASNFLSADSSGIMVYDGENGIQYPSTVSSGTNNVFIDSDSMDVRNGTTALASFGSTVILGKDDEYHTLINSDSFNILDSNNDVSFAINATGDTRTITALRYQRDRGSRSNRSNQQPGPVTTTTTCNTILQPDKVYTFSLHFSSLQTFTYSYSDADTADLSTITKTGTCNGSSCTTKINFSRYQIGGNRVVRVTTIEDTSSYVDSGGSGVRYWYAYRPKITITYPTEIIVSNAIINSRAYQLEDLFGTSSETISLGTYNAASVFSGAAGAIRFNIPTGRVFPEGTTISRITFNILGRVSNSNGTGYYFIKKTSGGTDLVSFDSSTSSTFYNANNTSKTLATSYWTLTLQGRTNILVQINGGDNFYANSTVQGYTNNNAAILELRDIVAYITLPAV